MQKLKRFIVKYSAPLCPTLVSSVIFIIVLTALAVGYSAYRHSAKSVNYLWGDLSKQIADNTTAKTIDYLKSSMPFLQFTNLLTLDEEIYIQDPLDVLSFGANAVKAYPSFVMVYYVKPDGTFISAQQVHSEDPVTGYVFSVEKDSQNAGMPTKEKIFRYEKDHHWNLVSESWGDYDPRTRPYWSLGIANPEGVWTKPYLFSIPKNALGVTYIQPVYEEGKLMGMWLVDYLLDTLSEYLTTLRMGDMGEVLIVDDDGTVIASSHKEWIVDEATGKLRNLNDIDAGDNLILKDTWKYLQTQYDFEKAMSSQFSYGNYLGYIQSFPEGFNVSWNVLTILPKAYFFDAIVKQAWLAVGLSLFMCVFFAFIGSVFFKSISGRLKKVAFEMEKVSHLEISSEKFSGGHFMVKEVNMMNSALDKMKSCLGSFAKYVPLSLISELIRSGEPAVLGGRKASLSILFVDLVNFTKLAEDKSPDDLIRILGAYLSSMTRLIEANSGTVDKYMGDAVMAFWGAPHLEPNHPRLACLTALAMKDAGKILFDDFHEKYGVALALRIGINTGEVIVGNVGSSERMDYTAIGDPVNLASRLESLNKLYSTQILIGETTANLVQSEFLVRPIDLVAVKGKDNASIVYELMCERKHAKETEIKAVSLYAEALNTYRKLEFSKAASLFAEANTLLGGSDTPSLLFGKRCKQLITNPPPPEWDAVVRFEIK